MTKDGGGLSQDILKVQNQYSPKLHGIRLGIRLCDCP